VADDIDLWMTRARDDDDAEAFALVVDRCQHLVRAVLLRDTADAELADELAQETLVRAWTKREQYRPGTSPKAWLMAIARSRLMDHHRRQDRDRRHLRDLVREELLRRAPEEDDQQRDQRLAAVQSCLDGLKPDQKELLDLIHHQGLSTEDSAEILGIKPAACRQRLSRLQRLVRSCAEERIGSTT
jgi:RNA polymerase sigma-70 factor (ECF subfamily)